MKGAFTVSFININIKYNNKVHSFSNYAAMWMTPYIDSPKLYSLEMYEFLNGGGVRWMERRSDYVVPGAGFDIVVCEWRQDVQSCVLGAEWQLTNYAWSMCVSMKTQCFMCNVQQFYYFNGHNCT